MSSSPVVSAIAWASSVLPVPGSPLTRSGLSRARAQLTAASRDSLVRYVGVPAKRRNDWVTIAFLIARSRGRSAGGAPRVAQGGRDHVVVAKGRGPRHDAATREDPVVARRRRAEAQRL